MESHCQGEQGFQNFFEKMLVFFLGTNIEAEKEKCFA